MIIQNFKDLATSQNKKDTLDILESGLEAAMPENILQHPLNFPHLIQSRLKDSYF